MKSGSTFRQALTALCEGNYTAADIRCVVEKLFEKTRRYLFHRESNQFRFRGEWINGAQEIDDLTLDFIAPLFARDDTGSFVELQEYFSDFHHLDEYAFDEKVSKLLNSVIHQQSIKLFRDRDPLGKAFYRSLRYLIQKHSNWHRTIRQNQSWVTSNTGGWNIPAEADEIIQVLHHQVAGEQLLTRQLEAVLTEFVDQRHNSVPIDDVLQYFRRQVNVDQYRGHQNGSPVETQLLTNEVSLLIKRTLDEIDKTILENYEHAGKLDSQERKGFLQSLEHLLNDMANGGILGSYFEYLSHSLDSLTNCKDYQLRYRTQFEYVAKKAKSKFSANLKSVLSI